MTVGIVTIVWRETPAELERFGKALAAAWARLPSSRRDGSVLVGNGASAETVSAAAQALTDAVGSPPQRLLLHRNIGPAKAYNEGFRATTADFVVLFDPDGAPDPAALERLLEALDAEPSAAATAASVVPFAAGARGPTTTVEAEWVSAGATVYRREALEAVGGFDPLFAYTCEEMDLGYRLRKGGWKLLREESAIFHHEIAHKTSWRRELRYIEFLMTWRHVHFSRLVTLKSWLQQFSYITMLARREGPKVAAGALLGLFAYLRHVPACEQRR